MPVERAAQLCDEYAGEAPGGNSSALSGENRSRAASGGPRGGIYDQRRNRIGRAHRRSAASTAPSPHTPAHDLGAAVIQAVLERAGVDADDVSETILGQVLTAGQGQNPARQAHINAGLPKESAAWSLNQVCGSGLRAVALGAQHIMLGDAEIVVAGGQESMSHVAARRAPARRAEDGRHEVHRHDDQGRPLGRLQRLPHGHHRRERGDRVADHPRAAGRVRGRLARTRPRPRRRPASSTTRSSPFTVKGRKGDVVGRQGRVHPPRRHASRRCRSCGPPSPRTARSPPATPRASTTAPRRCC